MKAKFYFGLILTFTLLYLSGCSTAQETTKDAAQTELKSEKLQQDSLDTAPASYVKHTVYIVQIGAFNTEEKAQAFLENAKKKINREVIQKYSPEVNLFVVQVEPFNTKKEAEEFRNNLWLNMEFSDAFVLTEDR